MTVRINPLIFKQHQAYSQQSYQINFSKHHKQQIAYEIMTNKNEHTHFLLPENDPINFEFTHSNEMHNLNNQNVLDTNDFNSIVDRF